MSLYLSNQTNRFANSGQYYGYNLGGKKKKNKILFKAVLSFFFNKPKISPFADLNPQIVRNFRLIFLPKNVQIVLKNVFNIQQFFPMYVQIINFFSH